MSRVKLQASSLGRRVDGRTLTLRRLLALTQETQWHAKCVVQNLDSNSADHSQRTQRERSTDVQGQWIDPGHAFRRLELKSKFGPCTDKISVSVNVKAIPLRRREKRRADAASQNGISFCDLKVIHMRYRSLINWNIICRVFACNGSGGVTVTLNSAGILLTVGSTIVECVVLHPWASKDGNQRQRQSNPNSTKRERPLQNGISVFDLRFIHMGYRSLIN